MGKVGDRVRVRVRVEVGVRGRVPPCAGAAR